MTPNEFLESRDFYSDFISQYDFSDLEKFPMAHRLFSTYGIGDRLTSNWQYDHESGQLTDQWRGQEYEDEAYDVLVQIAGDYADFVKSQASTGTGIELPASLLNLSNPDVGDIVEGCDGAQYRIIDLENQVVTLGRLDKEERVVSALLDGRVNI
jgi:hypothetical protein